MNSTRPSPSPSERTKRQTQNTANSNATIYADLDLQQGPAQTQFRQTQALPMTDEEYHNFLEQKRLEAEATKNRKRLKSRKGFLNLKSRNLKGCSDGRKRISRRRS